MADGILTISGFSDFRRLLTDYRKLENQVGKLQNKLGQVGKESTKTDSKQTRMLSNASRQVIGLVGYYASLQAAIAAVNAAMNEQIELGRKSTNLSMSLGDAQIQLFSALPKASEAQLAAMQQGARDISAETGISQAVMLREMVEVVSATIGKTPGRIKRTIAATREAAPLFRAPEQQGELGQFTGAMVDMMSNVPERSAQDMLMSMLALRSQARITENANLKNFVPLAAAARVAFEGADREKVFDQAMAIGAAIGGSAGDPTGEITRTAGANLLAILGNTIRADLLEKKDPRISKETDIIGMLRVIEKDPELLKKTVESLMGRAVTKPLQQELVEGGLTFDKFVDALEELQMTPREKQALLSRFRGQTSEDVRGANIIRERRVQQENTIRDRFKAMDRARVLLFGGEIDGETVPGELTSMVRPGFQGWADSLNKWGAKRVFELSAGNNDPTDAARDAIMTFLGFDGQRWNMGKHSKESVESLMGVLRDIKSFEEQNVKITQEALGAGNAASHTKAHTD